MHCCIVLRSPRLGWPHFTTIVDHSTLHFTTLVYHPQLTPDLLVVRQSYFHFQNRDKYGWGGLIWSILVYHPHLTFDLLNTFQSLAIQFPLSQRKDWYVQDLDNYTTIMLRKHSRWKALTYGAGLVCRCNRRHCQPPSLLLKVVQNPLPLESIFHPFQERP